MKRGRGAGFTLLELLVVISIVGILVGLVASTYGSTSVAAGQGAQSVASLITQTRLEALRQNGYVGLFFDVTNQRARMFVDVNRNGTYDTGDTLLRDIVFGATGAIERAKLASITGATVVRFDPRGLYNPATAVTIVVASIRDTSVTKTVAVTAQGTGTVQ